MALFDCDTEPPLPGLKMRTAMFSFVAPFCSASAELFAPWWLIAPWRAVCVPPPPEDPWLADCVVELPLSAAEIPATVLDCSTEPSSPELKIRTLMFVFFAPCCFASASESAYCLFAAA